MKLSARNQLAGTIVEIEPGPVSTLVKIDIGDGRTVSASITSDSADELGLAVGKPATAVFKSSSVMVGVD